MRRKVNNEKVLPPEDENAFLKRVARCAKEYPPLVIHSIMDWLSHCNKNVSVRTIAVRDLNADLSTDNLYLQREGERYDLRQSKIDAITNPYDLGSLFARRISGDIARGFDKSKPIVVHILAVNIEGSHSLFEYKEQVRLEYIIEGTKVDQRLKVIKTTLNNIISDINEMEAKFEEMNSTPRTKIEPCPCGCGDPLFSMAIPSEAAIVNIGLENIKRREASNEYFLPRLRSEADIRQKLAEVRAMPDSDGSENDMGSPELTASYDNGFDMGAESALEWVLREIRWGDMYEEI